MKVNLDDEILKLARKDGMTDPALLTQVISMTRRDNYANTVSAWYAGYDHGFASGLSNAAAPIIAWVRFKVTCKAILRSPVVAFFVGGLIVYVILRYCLPK